MSADCRVLYFRIFLVILLLPALEKTSEPKVLELDGEGESEAAAQAVVCQLNKLLNPLLPAVKHETANSHRLKRRS